MYKKPELGPVNTTQAVATGANFREFEERGVRCSELLERRETTKSGKLAPSLRVAAQIRPYFVLALDSGVATMVGLGLVRPDFHPQRHPPEKC